MQGTQRELRVRWSCLRSPLFIVDSKKAKGVMISLEDTYENDISHNVYFHMEYSNIYHDPQANYIKTCLSLII